MKSELESMWARINGLIQLLPTDHAVTAHLLAARTEIEEALALAPQHKP
jgi:hypothetical protein